MALVLKDRVLETCASPGVGTVTLLGATLGYQAFSSGVGDGNTCYYTIADIGGANWEVGIGTYTLAGNTLTRTTPISGSSATPVNFSGPLQNVFVTLPAEKARTVTQDTSPDNPTSNDGWYRSDQGVQYIYYNDVDSGQWVDTTSYMNAIPGSWFAFYSGNASTVYFDDTINCEGAARSFLPFTVPVVDGGYVANTESVYDSYNAGTASTVIDKVYGYTLDGGMSR